MKSFAPKIGIIIIVLFLITSAGVIFYNRNKNSLINYSQSGNSDSTLAASAENEGNIGEYYDGTKSSAASSSANQFSKVSDIKEYVYPSSAAKVWTSRRLELSTSDSAEKVTDWYKNKINELNFNAKAFSQTSTEGVIFNKLSAAKPGEKIEVTIKKDQTTSNTLITVDRS